MRTQKEKKIWEKRDKKFTEQVAGRRRREGQQGKKGTMNKMHNTQPVMGYGKTGK